MQKKYLYALVAIIIIVIVAALVVFTNKPSQTYVGLATFDNQPVPQSLISLLMVSNNVSNAANVTKAESNGVIVPISKTDLNASPLTLNGKPEMLYIGAEYCPYCGAERWAMIVTLLRFGSFTGLEYMTSSASDVDPSTPTFTFANATYTSPYITFVAVETTTNKPANSSYKGQTENGYPVLDTPNSSEDNLISTYDPDGSIPFIDIANRSVQVGASYNPQVILDGLNWTQAATNVNNPSTVQSEAIVSMANLFTAQICEADGNQPSSVCGQAYVTSIEKS